MSSQHGSFLLQREVSQCFRMLKAVLLWPLTNYSCWDKCRQGSSPVLLFMCGSSPNPFSIWCCGWVQHVQHQRFQSHTKHTDLLKLWKTAKVAAPAAQEAIAVITPYASSLNRQFNVFYLPIIIIKFHRALKLSMLLTANVFLVLRS